MHICRTQKNGTDDYICKTEIETQMNIFAKQKQRHKYENKHMGSKEGGKEMG